MSSIGFDNDLIRGSLLVDEPDAPANWQRWAMFLAGLALFGSGVLAGACMVAWWGWMGVGIVAVESVVMVVLLRSLLRKLVSRGF